MSRIYSSQLFWYRALILTIIWSVTFAFMLPIIVYIAPDVEAKIYPVLRDQEAQWPHASNDGDYWLWVWKFTKNRRATPQYVSFMAYSEADPQARYPVEVFVEWDCKRNFRADNASRPNDDVIRMMCARLPKNLIGKTDIVIDGFADYKVSHPFYTIPTKIISSNEKSPTD